MENGDGVGRQCESRLVGTDAERD